MDTTDISALVPFSDFLVEASVVVAIFAVFMSLLLMVIRLLR